MKLNCTTKFNVGDIVYMRTKNCIGQIVKQGPIRIKGIELRVDSKGKMTVWYNCESANLYKFAFYAKGSKHYVLERDLLTEQQVNELGYDVESKGYEHSYNPDGSPKTKQQEREAALQSWKDKGYKDAKIVIPSANHWEIETGRKYE